MHRLFASILAAACCWLAWRAVDAQELPIAPLVGENTWLVARLDVEKLQIEPLYALFEQTPPLPAVPSQEATAQFVERFRQAGGRQLYLVADGQAEIFAFAPLVSDAKAQAAGEVLTALPLEDVLAIETTAPLADGVFAGSRSMLLHLQDKKASLAPDFRVASAATSDFAFQLLLLPAGDNAPQVRRFVWALFQSAPAEAAASQIAWASIGIDAPPRPRLKVVLEAKDVDAVAGLQSELDKLFEPMLTHAAVRRNVALVENLRRILAWRRTGKTLTLELDDRQGDLTVLARGMIQPLLEARILASARQVTTNQMKQINIAFHNYHDTFKHFPPPAILSADGKPLLSWRVAILLFVEERELYEQFHLDEPWDSPHNIQLLARMPAMYRCPLSRAPRDHTVYLTPRGEGTVFEGPRGTPIRQIIDGTSNTISLVEVDDRFAVPWTKPEDWPFDPDQPTAGVGGHFLDVFFAASCDGALHSVPVSIDPEVMRRLISHDGREVVRWPGQ